MDDARMPTIEDVLAPFEQRAPATTVAEAAVRRDGLALGWELNRLQGAEQGVGSRRLAELYVHGRVTKDEYLKLAVALARIGHRD